MSNSYGPKSIVTDGLVFAADAKNTQCWTPDTSTAYNLIGSNSGSLFDSVSGSLGEYGSWYFNQINDEIRFESAGILSSSMTFSFWVKCDTSTHAILITTGANGSDGELYMKLLGGNIYVFDTSASVGQFIYKGGAFTQGEWVHLTVGLVNGGAIGDQKLYKNGVSIGFTNNSSNGNYINTSSTNPIYFGEESDSTLDFKGNLTNMMFYNKILTSSEVLQNYNSQKSRFGL